MEYSEMLQEMREWVELLEHGYQHDSGAALSPVDSYNLLRLLEEALHAIEDMKVRLNE